MSSQSKIWIQNLNVNTRANGRVPGVTYHNNALTMSGMAKLGQIFNVGKGHFSDHLKGY
jgi:hypothetical protein